MKREDLSQIINRIDDKYIDEATKFALEQKSETTGGFLGHKKRARRFKWHLAAACIALLVVIGSAAFAFAIEAQEYNTAVAFFEENGLSTEGLSRAEVKAVYRDIVEKRFSYGKTVEVLRQAVPGWEIQQDEPTSEEIADVWDNKVYRDVHAKADLSFTINWQDAYDERKGCEVFDKSIFTCYKNGEKIWSTEFKEFFAEGYLYAEEGAVVWGHENDSSLEQNYGWGWIALVGSDGTVRWQRRLGHDFRNEYVSTVLSNGDGTWAVFSKGGLEYLEYLCLSHYDMDGNECGFHKTEVGKLQFRNAACLGEGYLVQLRGGESGDFDTLYKMDREGRVTNVFSYEAEDCDYHINDMTEFGGKVYISADAVPRQTEKFGRREIENILAYCYKILSEEEREVSSEELTPIVRDNYTAVLLVCSPEDLLSPKTFYSVQGSCGGELSVNALGQLEWDVESISSVTYIPEANAYSLWGNSRLFHYTFDAKGILIEQVDTGEYVPYCR